MPFKYVQPIPKYLREPNLRAGVIFLDETLEKVLVVKQQGKDGLWGLPKGKPTKGECLRQTASRELKEETNIDIFIPNEAPPIKFYNYYFLIQTNLYILPRTNDQNEILKTKFIKISDLQKLPCNSDLRLFQKKWIIYKKQILSGQLKPFQVTTLIRNINNNEYQSTFQ